MRRCFVQAMKYTAAMLTCHLCDFCCWTWDGMSDHLNSCHPRGRCSK
jgi:hypothetical protein